MHRRLQFYSAFDSYNGQTRYTMRAVRRHVVVATVLLTRAVVQASQFVVNSSPPGYYDANTISDCSFWATVQSGKRC